MNNYYYGTVEHKSDLKKSIIIMHISNKTVHVIDLYMNNCIYLQTIDKMTISMRPLNTQYHTSLEAPRLAFSSPFAQCQIFVSSMCPCKSERVRL